MGSDDLGFGVLAEAIAGLVKAFKWLLVVSALLFVLVIYLLVTR